jgi:hypothetical protein
MLILFTVAMTAYVRFALDISEKRITAKTGFNFMIRLLMNFGLIATVIIGIIESFVKTNQLKEVYHMIEEVSTMCLAYFDHKTNYQSFKKGWVIKICISFSLLFLVYGSLVVNNVKHGRKALPFVIAFVPILFVGLLVFKLSFHYDLVNFQLENIRKMMSKEVFMKVNTTNVVSIRHSLQSRALGLRKIYNLIFDISEIVNNFLAYSALCIVVILTVVVINSSFNCIVTITKGQPLARVTRELCSKEMWRVSEVEETFFLQILSMF